jgi:CMP/dCMP kinase
VLRKQFRDTKYSNQDVRKMTSPGFIVAIDGPAGSGKSTTAKECARRLGFHYLDTGAMYRAVTLAVCEAGVNLADRRALGRLLDRVRLDMEWRAGKLKVSMNGRDVSEAIRAPGVSGFVSEVSAIPEVRKRMVVLQRRAALGQSLVCEGRDIGSVVFPQAQLKVFLDCDVEARALRRDKELHDRGLASSRNAVRRNLAKRDRIDSGRAVAPLVRVPDAVLVDTTYLTIEEQVAVVCDLARRRSARPGAQA